MIWLLVALCWIISFLFAGIEAGLLALDPVRIAASRQERRSGARRLQEMLKEPDRLLITVLLVTNAADITALIILTHELVLRLGWRRLPNCRCHRAAGLSFLLSAFCRSRCSAVSHCARW